MIIEAGYIIRRNYNYIITYGKQIVADLISDFRYLQDAG